MADDPETPPNKRSRDSLEGGTGSCDAGLDETRSKPTIANYDKAKPREDAADLESDSNATIANYQIRVKNEPQEDATDLDSPKNESKPRISDYQINVKTEPQEDPATLNRSSNSPNGECSPGSCSLTSKFLDPETVHDRILIVNGKKFYVLEEMFSPYFKAKLAETSEKEVHLPMEYFEASIEPEDFASFLKFLYWKKNDKNVKNFFGLMGFSCHFKEEDFWKTVCLKHIRDEIDFPEQVDLFSKMLASNFPNDYTDAVMHIIGSSFESGRYIEAYSDVLLKLGEDYDLEYFKEAVSSVCHGFFFDANTRDKLIYIELALRHNMEFLKDDIAEYLNNFLYPKHRDGIRKKMQNESGDVATPAPVEEEAPVPDQDVKYPITTHSGVYGFLIENRDRLPSIAPNHKAFIMDSMLCRGTSIRHRDVCMVYEYSQARRKDSCQHAVKYDFDYNFSDHTREHDTVLVVSGKKFFVKKGFLMLESKYLNNLFSTGSDGDIVLQMEDVTPDNFEEFLAALYMSSKFPFTKENVAGLLRMANKFELGDHECSLWESCQSFIENELSIMNIMHFLEEMVKNNIRADKIKKVVDLLSVNMKSHFPQIDDLTTIVRIAAKLNIEELLTGIELICMDKFNERSPAEKYPFVELAVENNMVNLKTRIEAFLSDFVLKWDRREQFIGEQDLKKRYEQEASEARMFSSAGKGSGIKKHMKGTNQHREERNRREVVYYFLLWSRESILSASIEVKAFLLDSMIAK